MDERQALPYASSILRTLAAGDFTRDPGALLYAARQPGAFSREKAAAGTAAAGPGDDHGTLPASLQEGTTT
jgi:hypothetical protein